MCLPKGLSHRGFTLTELLVVITILVVLLGLLLPAIGMVRDSARTVSCLSNMRQIGLAISNYSNENDGFMPAVVAPWDNNKVYDTRLCEAYELPAKLWRCPMDHRVLPAGEAHRSYAINHFRNDDVTQNDGWCQRFAPYQTLAISQFQSPSESILLSDFFTDVAATGFTGSLNYFGKGPFSCVDGYIAKAGIPDFGSKYYHRSKINYLFADGHAKSHDPATIYDNWQCRVFIQGFRPPL
jgi:prepilin-type N-terminal cleavage/methylation domain-containing protein/prepilin-type processing-associated H-X9-DG protein